LVERAAEQEMDALALTDRDGVYGAVRFAKACLRMGVRPILGVDLAMAVPSVSVGGRVEPKPRTPVRGGAFRDARLPRVTFLAGSGQGWAAICRLISAIHLAGERGDPVCTSALVAEHVAGKDVLVLLGPDSEVGRAITRRRDDLARVALDPWREMFPAGDLHLEVMSHRLAGSGPGSSPHAARMLGLAREMRIGSVLSNAIRYADRLDAPVTDVLDAARRLVPLDPRHVDRGNAEGFLKSGKQMAEVAEEICRFAGDEVRWRDLMARTRAIADRCVVDPRTDLGLGEVHFPEFGGAVTASRVLRERCESAIGWRYADAPRQKIWKRLHDELEVIDQLGYASYFLTVAEVADLIREMGVRAAARGSGAGSLVNYLLGVSGVDPLRYGLLMERFLSPLRQALPDIDIDVESARRLEVYTAILDRFGGERCACVSMMDTYRVRHAIRDVGAALGMPRAEIDAIAKAFPHIRARDARMALRELPELRNAGLLADQSGFDLFFGLVERLDGLPRHIAVHPCGVLLSDQTLLDRTPVEASYAGFPMSQFDKEDVEDLGLLKLDVLGIRMQSAMAHAVDEILRVEGVEIDLDDQTQVPLDDPATYRLISSAKTLGCFQIESPGQRELVGKSGIESFEDLIVDISLFRPGPVKSDMVTPYLNAKQGWNLPTYLHESFRPILEQTQGVVVFHEQVIELISAATGCSLAEADEARRALGDVEGMAQTKLWFFPRALRRGYSVQIATELWRVLEAFASFGFCKAHAAAFALPTFQSAWLKTHYPAHFLAGVLTHDPGMYPKRLILDDARQFGITILGLDVNRSEQAFVVEQVEEGRGIRLALAEVKGISEAEVGRILAARPYQSLSDFWQRAGVSRPIVERLVMAGGFDSLYGIASNAAVGRRGQVSRRDLLLQIADLERYSRGTASAGRSGRSGQSRQSRQSRQSSSSTDERSGVWAQAAAQSCATRQPDPVTSVQMAFDLGPVDGESSGLPEMTGVERVRAELEVLGLDASRHIIDFHAELLDGLGVTRSADLLKRRSKADLLVAGVKVATQTPPIRSGRRVIFLTLDDTTGPVDVTFFEDVQGPYAATVFNSWLLVARGELRRTGRRGVSLRATGCWDLALLADLAAREGIDAARRLILESPGVVSRRPTASSTTGETGAETGAAEAGSTAGGMGRRRVLVHSSGFRMSPYSDIKTAGEDVKEAPRKLWHSSPGSSGR
jgi:error-prone DNA polymerase